MRTVEVSDEAAFVAKADAIGAPIRVVRFTKVEPVQVGNPVSMVPDLSDTLFTDLEKRGGYELVHRSGSF